MKGRIGISDGDIWRLKDTPKNKFFKVLDLTRVSMGTLPLDLEPGLWRYLSEAESEKMVNFKK